MSILFSPVKSLTLQSASTSPVSITGATETSLFPPGMGNKMIPGSWFTPGANARLVLYGTVSTPLATGTATVRVKIGGNTLVSATTTSILSLVSSQAFSLRCNIQCWSIGPNGTFGIGGELRYPSGLLGVAVGSQPLISTTASFNTLIEQPIDVTLQWAGLGATATTAIAYLELMPLNSM